MRTFVRLPVNPLTPNATVTIGSPGQCGVCQLAWKRGIRLHSIDAYPDTAWYLCMRHQCSACINRCISPNHADPSVPLHKRYGISLRCLANSYQHSYETLRAWIERDDPRYISMCEDRRAKLLGIEHAEHIRATRSDAGIPRGRSTTPQHAMRVAAGLTYADMARSMRLSVQRIHQLDHEAQLPSQHVRAWIDTCAPILYSRTLARP
jgi:hypothetical protein